MTVVIAPNIKKVSERIDPSGNIINPRTREIIKPIESEYVPPFEQPTTTASIGNIPPVNIPNNNPLSVIDQIKQAKEHLAQLEELKKLKIAEKEAELELLKQ